jgi:tRNA A37 threonylcarbamoyladenosine modification protein TsaB
MAAKALSDVLGVPLVAPDSLEALCIEAEGRAEKVVVVMDAKRGQVYYGFYRLDKGRPEVEEGPGVAGPEQLAERISAWRGNLADGMAITGTGLDAFPDAWPSDLPRIEGHSPTPRGLARLCRAYEAEGKFNHPLELLPLYIRRPDARERAAGGKGGKGCG